MQKYTHITEMINKIDPKAFKILNIIHYSNDSCDSFLLEIEPGSDIDKFSIQKINQIMEFKLWGITSHEDTFYLVYTDM